MLNQSHSWVCLGGFCECARVRLPCASQPDPWSIKQANRAARKEAEEWQRCLDYKEPKPHGGKCVNFQSALRNAIGPRMEIKQLTYDEIRTRDLMEASQLFLPPSAKKSAIKMHYHMQTHGIRPKVSECTLSIPLTPRARPCEGIA